MPDVNRPVGSVIGVGRRGAVRVFYEPLEAVGEVVVIDDLSVGSTLIQNDEVQTVEGVVGVDGVLLVWIREEDAVALVVVIVSQRLAESVGLRLQAV